MKYLCLVYLEEKPKAGSDAWMRDALAYDEALKGRGRFLAAEALQPAASAATVKVRGGRISLGDGPFAGTREQLAGFILIEARDLNAAVQAAAKIPGAHCGSVEVRPVRDPSGETEAS
jgi:hypothetical protein